MPTLWLLEDETRLAMDAAFKAGSLPTAQQQADYEASVVAASANGPRLLNIAGDVAVVNVTGILTDAPDLMAKWFGGGNTVYSEIRDAIAAADANHAVSRVVMGVSSPGGSATAEWLSTMEAIAGARKPIEAMVGNMAASAAYGLASQAKTIRAQNKLSRVGSIGVVASFYANEGLITITSSDAPNKRPDISTEEGKATVRAELDQMHQIFAESVAKGRKVSVKTVNTNFGRGGMLLAADAVEAGMIDGLAGHPAAAGRISIAANSGAEGVHTMDLTEFKAKHPETYAQVVALGVDQGVKAERDRVVAHITMAEATDCNDVALKAIKDGEQMTATLTAQYMAAGINKRDGKSRVDEDAAAAAALKAAGGKSTEQQGENADADAVLALVSAQLGEV